LGVYTEATPLPSRISASSGGMMPAHHHGAVDPGGPQAVDHVGHQLHVGARQDGEPDDVDVLVPGGRHDLGRGQPDALVDDLEPGVAGGHGDLLGPVGVPVEARLGHQQAGRAARALGQGLGAGQTGPTRAPVPDAAADPGGGPELAEDLAQGAGPLPGGAAGVGQGDGGLHDVAAGPVVLGHPAQLVERPAHGGAVAVGPPALHVGDLLGLDRVVHLQDRCRSHRRRSGARGPSR
jgi:hypothetical protein